MKRLWAIAALAATAVTVTSFDVDAARLGGGRSFGRQSPPSVMQRQAPPSSAPAAPVQPPVSQMAPAQAPRPAAAPAAAGAAAAAAAPSRSRWLAPLAGVAAGLGLAALASHLGFGEGFGQFMLVLLLIVVAFAVFRMIRARSSAAARPVSRMNPLQPTMSYTTVGQEAAIPNYAPVPPSTGARSVDVVRPVQAASSELAPSTAWRVPDDFDRDGFLKAAKSQYVRLQAAYDAADMTQLREYTSDEVFEQLRLDIGARAGASNHTDVVTLNAELLGLSSERSEHMASVRFHGMARESATAAATAFDEVWNLTKPSNGSSGWVLAGIQPLS